MAYVTLAAFTEYVASEIAADQAFLQGVLTAVEDAINEHCGRHFNPPSGGPLARSYRPEAYPDGDLVVVHDLVDSTGLTITDDGDPVALGEVQLEPLHTWGGPPRPFWVIRRLDACWARDRDRATVTVTSNRWGWAAVPPQVSEATKILGKDIVHVRQNRFGVAAFGEFGVIRARDNPHVAMLLEHLRHPAGYGSG